MNQDQKVYFVIVIYNKECSESQSVLYAKNHKIELDTIVVDNSTIETANESFCKNNGFKYISMRGNAGLPRAYNQAIAMIDSFDGFIVWADDDTEFPDNYLDEMMLKVKSQNLIVGLPVVLSGNDLYSPITVDEYGVPKRVRKIEEIGEHITGINSGMLVNLSLYKNYSYDENMFLDFVDHDICAYCLENGIKIGVIKNVVLKQNSFFSSKIKMKSMQRRRRIYKRDFRYFCKKHGIDDRIARSKLFHGDISICLKYIKQLCLAGDK